MSILKDKFNNTMIKELKDELGLATVAAVPRITKVVVSAKTGALKDDKDAVESIRKELAEITGQMPKINLSRKAVSSFKLRIGQPVGLTVTLRGERMYDFISKLTNVALPRVRDFKGLPRKSFDGQGNYTVGVQEHIIMPEAKYEGSTRIFGFQVNITTTAKSDEHALALLSKLGFPFEKI